MPDYRQRCFEEHGEACIECGSEEEIQVHHIDGDRNNNDPENLIPLCKRHHRQLHRDGLDGLEEELKPTDQRSHIDQSKVTFQMAARHDEWQTWKETVPRRKSLETRINELIRADTAGRVLDDEELIDGLLEDLPDDSDHRAALEAMKEDSADDG